MYPVIHLSLSAIFVGSKWPSVSPIFMFVWFAFWFLLKSKWRKKSTICCLFRVDTLTFRLKSKFLTFLKCIFCQEPYIYNEQMCINNSKKDKVCHQNFVKDVVLVTWRTSVLENIETNVIGLTVTNLCNTVIQSARTSKVCKLLRRKFQN